MACSVTCSGYPCCTRAHYYYIVRRFIAREDLTLDKAVNQGRCANHLILHADIVHAGTEIESAYAGLVRNQREVPVIHVQAPVFQLYSSNVCLSSNTPTSGSSMKARGLSNGSAAIRSSKRSSVTELICPISADAKFLKRMRSCRKGVSASSSRKRVKFGVFLSKNVGPVSSGAGALAVRGMPGGVPGFTRDHVSRKVENSLVRFVVSAARLFQVNLMLWLNAKRSSFSLSSPQDGLVPPSSAISRAYKCVLSFLFMVSPDGSCSRNCSARMNRKNLGFPHNNRPRIVVVPFCRACAC